jgi:hypothetical protein
MYSEYQMGLREGIITVSFDDAVKQGTKMWDKCYTKINRANSALLDCQRKMFGEEGEWAPSVRISSDPYIH